MPGPLSQGQAALKYRPDIDGLRAIAVLLVIAGHLPTRLAGGFVGVDVFFVISGYLISSLILSQLKSGTFSIAHFYERRVRRIAPGLLAMLLGTTILACFILDPSELVAFARTLLAALFSVSNLVFYRQAGYFDETSALKPLLHTWSLGVEEQFYLSFPLFLVAMWRFFPKRLKAVVCSLAVLSFVLDCVYVQRNPAAAFFWAPLRAWELLLGTIISQRYTPAIRGLWSRNVAAICGLLLIVAPAFLYSVQSARFPGLLASPPCLGTALIIVAGEHERPLVGSLLAWRPIAFIGLISYSLYLWQWPALVFLERTFLITPTSASRGIHVAVIAALLAIGTLSWRFVETPFRSGRFRSDRRSTFVLTGMAAALLAAIGVSAMASKGFPFRYSSEALSIDRYSNYDPSSAFRSNVCFMDPITGAGADFATFNKEACLADDPKRKHYLLMGDSHAAHLYPGLHAVFGELNLSQATTPCKPFLTQPGPADDVCVRMWNYIYGDYLIRDHVDAVLLSGRWAETDFPNLQRAIVWLQQRGLAVILFGPVPEYDAPLPQLLILSIHGGGATTIDRHRTIEPLRTDQELSELARNRWNARYISTYEDLCGAGAKDEPSQSILANCPVYGAAGVPLQFDDDHFTPEGSILYARAIKARKQLP